MIQVIQVIQVLQVAGVVAAADICDGVNRLAPLSIIPVGWVAVRILLLERRGVSPA